MASFLHVKNPPELRGALRALRPVLLSLAWLASAYLFALAIAREDRLGERTLALASWLVALLRGVGRMIEMVLKAIRIRAPLENFASSIAGPLPQVIGALLIVTAALSPMFLPSFRPPRWRRLVPLSLAAIGLMAACPLMFSSNPWLAALLALVGGAFLLAAPNKRFDGEPGPLLLLAPLGLGIILRFYALAQVPNGYAEHAAILNAKLSLPYFEALSASLNAFQLQPFLGVAWNALLHEQSGLLALVTAIGFKIFGINLTITRLISAVLGTLTIYIAYLLGKALGGGRLGLIFSFLLAVAPWHITISRYSTAEHVLAPLQLLLALLFLVRSVNRGQVSDIVLAAFFSSFAWYVYASNLALPVIAALFLLYRAAREPRLVIRNWWKVLVGISCFVLLSIAPITNEFPQGISQPSVRTGYGSAGPLWSDWPKRLTMLNLETSQLFQRADDPWFATPGPGLGLLQTTLLIAGLVLAAGALRQKESQDLGILLLLGIPIGVLPAVFAPDPSFRRLMVVTTLAALAAAFVFLRLLEAANAEGISGGRLAAVVGVGALAVASAGAFGYFDRSSAGEELRNAWFRALGAAVSDSIGRQPLLVVIPNIDQLDDANRYIELMSYDVLADAEKRGIAQGMLYVTATCQQPLGIGEQGIPQDATPLVIAANTVLDPNVPACGPDFLIRLKALYPNSQLIVTDVPALPPDLQPAAP
jgi:dolichyl-phosphate-mannose-protein mannosyltransferase